MKYIGILGRQPELGLIELESLLGPDALTPHGRSAVLLETAPDINTLGGVQKIGRVVYIGPAAALEDLDIDWSELAVKQGKTTFGLSYYGLNATSNFAAATGTKVKKKLQRYGSVRFVAPTKDIHLSAAQIKFNQLLTKGFELCVVIHKQTMIVAATEQIQDIDWYSERDYNRPARSAKVGMLPPKLAQIMVNTTRAGLVADLFCGTGVILQEALLLGREAYGADVSADMVRASTENLQWLGTIRDNLPKWTIETGDARDIIVDHKPLSIVTEGYLGPNLTHRLNSQQLNDIRPDLQKLYVDCLTHWSHWLPSGTEVTLTAPYWHTQAGWRGLDIVDLLPDLGYIQKQFAHAKSDALIYRRSNQIVGRQLLILRKK